ncbi:TPA: phage baseplate protein, partial [Escherichia coli]
CSSLNIDAPDGVNMNTPLLKVSGDIQDNASSQSSTVKNLRDNYNNHKHSVSGVQSGGSTINSNATDKPT